MIARFWEVDRPVGCDGDGVPSTQTEKRGERIRAVRREPYPADLPGAGHREDAAVGSDSSDSTAI